MKSKERNKGLIDLFWSLMESMKSAVLLLIILTIVSLVGVLLPQFLPNGFTGSLPELYLSKYGSVVGGIFVFLGLDHVFTVWWYYLFLMLLCLNITVCSVKRLRVIVSMVRKVDFLDGEEKYRKQSNNRIIKLELPVEQAIGSVGEIFKRSGYRVSYSHTENQNNHLLYARRGALSHFGPFFTHISMVIIIIGAAIAYTLSFEHFQWLAPGEVIEIPNLSYIASPAYQLGVMSDRLAGAFGIQRKSSPLMIADRVVRESDWRRLPENLSVGKKFRVRLEKFDALFTSQGRPKAYLSTVTVLSPEDGDEELYSYSIKVNDPLIHQGVYFYQSSYSPGGGGAQWVDLSVVSSDSLNSRQYSLKVKPGANAIPLGTSGDSIRIERFVDSFKLGSDGQVTSQPGDDINPAAQVVITRGGEELSRSWVFKNFPEFSHRQQSLYSVTMGDYGKSYITGLTVRTHRSQIVIWIGFALMVAGVLLSFYVNHRQMWVMVKPEDSGSRVYLAGTSYKWKQPFLAEFKSLGEKIRKISRN